ncbi:MAG: response regulator [Actinomycetota bacterium]|nr:response regulator [Actinomycetota bacterium]
MTDSVAPRVLVADDDQDIRELVLLNLEAEGYRVAAAEDGDQAWAMVKAVLPDLVVLDVMMPGRDGLDVLADLRAHPETRGIPVVLLTARASDTEVWSGWQSGADLYMTKPFEVEDLLGAVSYLLRECAARRAAETVIPQKLIY